MRKIIFASFLLDISAIWIDNLGFFENGMSPDYERNFASQWWEYPDEYEDDLTDLNNLILAPCHAYLQQIPQSKWGTGKSEFYLGAKGFSEKKILARSVKEVFFKFFLLF